MRRILTSFALLLFISTGVLLFKDTSKEHDAVGGEGVLSERQIQNTLDARMQNGKRPVQVGFGARMPEDEISRGYSILDVYGQVFPDDIAIDVHEYPDGSWGYTIRQPISTTSATSS